VCTLSEELARHGRNDAIVVLVRAVEDLDRLAWELRDAYYQAPLPAVLAELERVHRKKLDKLLDAAALCELAELPELKSALEAIATVVSQEGW
jgi:hypothetical protein